MGNCNGKVYLDAINYVGRVVVDSFTRVDYRDAVDVVVDNEVVQEPVTEPEIESEELEDNDHHKEVKEVEESITMAAMDIEYTPEELEAYAKSMKGKA